MNGYDRRELARIDARMRQATFQIGMLRGGSGALMADADVGLRAEYVAALARDAALLADRLARRAARRRASA